MNININKMSVNAVNCDYGYIYIRNHLSYDAYGVCKMGKATNIPDRDTQYATGEIKRGYFEDVYKVNIKQMGFIERILQHNFRDLNVKYDAGTEFYGKQIITLIEHYLDTNGFTYRKLSKQEIRNLLRPNRIKQTQNKIKHILNKIKIKSLIHALKNTKRTNDQYIWKEREYQTDIINFSTNNILIKYKIYIELPTGGGKSYIVYNLFEQLKSEFIIIVSPRKIVNSQNISPKYLQILKDKYNTFNCSVDANFEEFLKLFNKKIVICCTQSINKIYEHIISNNITNITIWFDEAYWGIEEWVNNVSNNTYSQFWLLNDNYIKYRIFTSASPNKKKVLENERIFGQLYSPIKVKELINLNWLSPINPYVYSENKTNVNSVKYIIDVFNEKNRKHGFSFHNKQKNAFNLFHNHYILYKNGHTHIKPFLLVSDNFTTEREPKLTEIVLDYDYKNITTYETTIHSIGYVVAKYSMGYDFKGLDFICVSDPKLSLQDIIQCIGRGIRPDELGINGTNKEKELVVCLPIYIDDADGNKYDKVIEVLKYLLYDIEILFEDIEFKNKYTPNFKEEQHKSNEYLGINDVKAELLNLLEIENNKIALSTTYERAKKILADKNITSKEEYYKLCNKNNRLPKEPDVAFKGQFINWIEYLNIKRIYHDLETCKNIVRKNLAVYPEIKTHYLDLSIVTNELCKIDPLFPPNGLWVEYYNVKDLRDIITISNRKKKTGIIL